MNDNKKALTNNFGAPVDDDLNSLTAGNPGPVLMQDVHLLEKLSHFDRERIPDSRPSRELKTLPGRKRRS